MGTAVVSVLATIGTGSAILAILGLVIGLVVLLLVIFLFNQVLTPVREITRLAREAPEVAPFITTGVKGVDQLSRTNQLAGQVPPLALAYLDKVQSGAPPAPGRAPAPGPGAAAPSAVGIGRGKA